MTNPDYIYNEINRTSHKILKDSLDKFIDSKITLTKDKVKLLEDFIEFYCKQ